MLVHDVFEIQVGTRDQSDELRAEHVKVQSTITGSEPPVPVISW